MATSHRCPNCGGVFIRDDRGERLGKVKGVTWRPSGNECNCSRSTVLTG